MSIAKTTADHTAAAPSDGAGKPSSWFLFWGGAILSLSLIPIFALQVFWAKALITPWYLPIGGTVSALIVIYAIGRRRRWWRLGVALGCVAIAGLEWYFLLALTVLPLYIGPIVEGSTIPVFRATLADGTEINESYFQRSRTTALVFFQGRWCPFCMTQLRELESHHGEFSRVKADVVVVSIEDLEAAAQTQRDFPHLTVVSDQRRELSNAIDLINKGSAPDGGDSSAPTILLLDGNGTVHWLHRPTRFIARPSAAELVAAIEGQQVR
ncbi:MAG: redoxin domain-containing protein [Pirellulales bacterium]